MKQTRERGRMCRGHAQPLNTASPHPGLAAPNSWPCQLPRTCVCPGHARRHPFPLPAPVGLAVPSSWPCQLPR
eukprot:222106-Chlamydomonas_euryale.AAC.2